MNNSDNFKRACIQCAPYIGFIVDEVIKDLAEQVLICEESEINEKRAKAKALKEIAFLISSNSQMESI